MGKKNRGFFVLAAWMMVFSVGSSQMVLAEKRMEGEEAVEAGEAGQEAVNGYIFIGDSRFVGMDQFCRISSEPGCFVFAKSGAGYKWMTDFGIPAADAAMENHPEITDWTIISGFGINDLHNAEKYADAYRLLSEQVRMIVLSVNPVGKGSRVRNSDIIRFNGTIAETEGIEYLDTYTFLAETGFYARDGVHYDRATCQKTWEYMKEDDRIFVKQP